MIENGILKLSNSILKRFTGSCRHETLEEFDRLLEKGYKNTVLMLFDGMGTNILEKHLAEDSFLRRNSAGTLATVFPPTTTAALTTLESGLSPAEHGWLGWRLYFPEIGGNVDIYNNVLSGSGGQPAADYHAARKFMPYESITDMINNADNDFSAYCVSKFSDFAVKNEDEIFSVVETLCGRDGEKFIYTYYHQPDYDIHEYGTGNARIKEFLTGLDGKLDRLCGKLSDTLVLITADHGLIDTEDINIIGDAELLDCLNHYPSIEARTASFSVKKGRHMEFERLFADRFGNEFILYAGGEAMEKKLFGEGAPHPRTRGFIADYLAVATGNKCIFCVEPEFYNISKARHAGNSRDEFEVPMVIIANGK